MSEVSAQVKQTFESMNENFNPQAAAGMDAVIQYDLTGDGAASYHATIREGTCAIAEGQHDSPQMTLTMDAGDFLDLISGKLDGMSAFMSGKLRIAGDMGLAMKLQSLFRSS